jgi:hypothetical protein
MAHHLSSTCLHPWMLLRGQRHLQYRCQNLAKSTAAVQFPQKCRHSRFLSSLNMLQRPKVELSETDYCVNSPRCVAKSSAGAACGNYNRPFGTQLRNLARSIASIEAGVPYFSANSCDRQKRRGRQNQTLTSRWNNPFAMPCSCAWQMRLLPLLAILYRFDGGFVLFGVPALPKAR